MLLFPLCYALHAGQQIRYKIDIFQNANFLISKPNPMMLPLIGIVSERRFQWGSHHKVWLRNEKVIMKTVLVTLSLITVALYMYHGLIYFSSVFFLLLEQWQRCTSICFSEIFSAYCCSLLWSRERVNDLDMNIVLFN